MTHVAPLRRYWPYVLGYIITTFQFVISSQNLQNTHIFRYIIRPFKAIGVDDPNFVSSIIFIPLYAIVVFIFDKIISADYFDRKTVKDRMPEFRSEISDICIYHRSRDITDYIDQLKKNKITNYYINMHRYNIGLTHVEFILTDIQNAIRKLVKKDDIRIVVFTLRQSKNGAIVDEYLRASATTELGRDLSTISIFRRDQTTGNLEGLCGAAWDTGVVQVSKRSGRPDERVAIKNEPKNKSYMCIPVHDFSHGHARIAILSIDSSAPNIFYIDKEYLDEMLEYIAHTFPALVNYIDLMVKD